MRFSESPRSVGAVAVAPKNVGLSLLRPSSGRLRSDPAHSTRTGMIQMPICWSPFELVTTARATPAVGIDLTLIVSLRLSPGDQRSHYGG